MTFTEKVHYWGLWPLGFGCEYHRDGSVTAWTGDVSRKGYVRTSPMEPGVIWAKSEDEALEKLSVMAL